MLGAIREDDGPYDAASVENTPVDDPDGAFYRVFNHFYDPYNDPPLTILTELGSSAPDWALGTLSLFSLHGNTFSIKAAREAMWRAATLRYGASLNWKPIAFAPAQDVPTSEALRYAYWATTFRALGDV